MLCYKKFVQNKNRLLVSLLSYFPNMKKMCIQINWKPATFLIRKMRVQNKRGAIFQFITLLPNRHIFIDSPSIRRPNSTGKVCGDFIDFERRIHVEIMTSIRRGSFDLDSTFKLGKISMRFLRGFFYVVSTTNRHSFCTCCFHSIIC